MIRVRRILIILNRLKGIIMIDRRIKRNQHYVPQSYLRRFTIEGEQSLLWNFDKEVGGFLRQPSSVNRICCEDYYYYQIDEQGEVNHIALEDAISDIERIGNNIIDDIINMSAMPNVYLSIEKKSNLAFYIALMQTRGPAFRNGINELYGDVAVRALKATVNSKFLVDTQSPLKQLIEEKGLLEVIRPSILTTVSLAHMLEGARQIAQSFLLKQWTVLTACHGSEFITSDNPVTFFSKTAKYGVGPGHRAAITVFPLSPKLCLYIESAVNPDLELNIRNCSELEQSEFNKLIYNGAMKNVLSTSKNEWLDSYSKVSKSTGQKITMSKPINGFDVVRNPFKKR